MSHGSRTAASVECGGALNPVIPATEREPRVRAVEPGA